MPALFVLGRSSQIFHSYALTGIGSVGWFGVRVLQDADKSVMDHHPLAAVFAHAFGFIYRDMIDQLPQQRCCQLVHLHKSADGGGDSGSPAFPRNRWDDRIFRLISRAYRVR